MNTIRYIDKIEYVPTKSQLSVFLISDPENQIIDCSIVFNDVRCFYEQVIFEDYDEPYIESCIDITETVVEDHRHYLIVTDEREISFDAYQMPTIWFRSGDL